MFIIYLIFSFECITEEKYYFNSNELIIIIIIRTHVERKAKNAYN